MHERPCSHGAGAAACSDAERYERRVTSEMRHPVYTYKISHRRVFEVQARVLAAALIGEIDSYVPVVTR